MAIDCNSASVIGKDAVVVDVAAAPDDVEVGEGLELFIVDDVDEGMLATSMEVDRVFIKDILRFCLTS